MWNPIQRFSRVVLLVGAALAATYLLSDRANAQPVVQVDTVGIHVGSHHWPQRSCDSCDNWNNRNPGIYLAGSINNRSGTLLSGRYVVGTYFNSERKESYYVGRIYPVFDNLDVVLGAISGYKAAPVMPMLVPSVHFGLVDGWSARIHYLPKVEKSGAHVVHLSIERKF